MAHRTPPISIARRGIRNLASASLLSILLLPSQLAAQQSSAPVARLQFAAILPSDSRSQGHRVRVTGNQLETTNTSLADLLCFAYGLHDTQILAAPDWIRSVKYDVTLQADATGPTNEVFWTSILQKYLNENFRLAFHRDTRDLPLYVLTIGQSTPRIKASRPTPQQLPELSIILGKKNASISATNATIADLASVLQRVVLEWPVVDRTGLSGRYDFALSWAPTGPQFARARVNIRASNEVPNSSSSLTSALRQIGLTLDLIEAPLAVLVFDDVERPSETYAARYGITTDGPGWMSQPWGFPIGTRFFPVNNPFLATNNLY